MNEQILIVDDDPDLLEIFEMSLEALGYKILTASDGETGVEMYKKHKPCMVFQILKCQNWMGVSYFQLFYKFGS